MTPPNVGAFGRQYGLAFIRALTFLFASAFSRMIAFSYRLRRLPSLANYGMRSRDCATRWDSILLLWQRAYRSLYLLSPPANNLRDHFHILRDIIPFMVRRTPRGNLAAGLFLGGLLGARLAFPLAAALTTPKVIPTAQTRAFLPTSVPVRVSRCEQCFFARYTAARLRRCLPAATLPTHLPYYLPPSRQACCAQAGAARRQRRRCINATFALHSATYQHHHLCCRSAAPTYLWITWAYCGAGASLTFVLFPEHPFCFVYDVAFAPPALACHSSQRGFRWSVKPIIR